MIVDETAFAEHEVTEAVKHCLAINPSIAEALLFEYDEAVKRIVEHPNAWSTAGKGLRRCLLSSFP